MGCKKEHNLSLGSNFITVFGRSHLSILYCVRCYHYTISMAQESKKKKQFVSQMILAPVTFCFSFCYSNLGTKALEYTVAHKT